MEEEQYRSSGDGVVLGRGWRKEGVARVYCLMRLGFEAEVLLLRPPPPARSERGELRSSGDSSTGQNLYEISLRLRVSKGVAKLVRSVAHSHNIGCRRERTRGGRQRLVVLLPISTRASALIP